MANKIVSKELRLILSKRLLDEGWPNIKSFITGTSPGYSLETVRRAFNECEYKNMEATTLAVVMHRLNYSAKEIKELLQEHGYKDDPLLDIIYDNGLAQPVDHKEEKLLEAYKIIVEADPSLSSMVADQLEVVARMANVNIKKQATALRK